MITVTRNPEEHASDEHLEDGPPLEQLLAETPIIGGRCDRIGLHERASVNRDDYWARLHGPHRVSYYRHFTGERVRDIGEAITVRLVRSGVSLDRFSAAFRAELSRLIDHAAGDEERSTLELMRRRLIEVEYEEPGVLQALAQRVTTRLAELERDGERRPEPAA